MILKDEEKKKKVRLGLEQVSLKEYSTAVCVGREEALTIASKHSSSVTAFTLVKAVLFVKEQFIFVYSMT